MNTFKLSLIILFIFAAFGCIDKQPQYETYNNQEITACGVKDPLTNYPWLSNFIEENKESVYNITIYLYTNIATSEDNIVIDISPNRGEHSQVSIDIYFWRKIYTCAGEQLFIIESEGIDREGWDNFFNSGNNTIKGIIWYRKIVYPE